MNYESLKKWRFLVPSFIIIIIWNALHTNSFAELAKISNLKITELTFISIGVAGIYYIFNVRNILTRKQWKKVNNFIKNTLKEFCYSNDYVEDLEFNNTKYMDVFYSLVDKNQSLRTKSKKVMANGLALTSLADLAILFFPAAIIFLIRFFVSCNVYFIHMFAICCVISIISFLAMKKYTSKHIELSGKQLNFITNQLKDELKDEVNK